ncbi:MAG TPA: hypothetical protein PLW81_00640 [Thiobacillaceae bacterium]|nr:hypothetical protein [Thiobacillaceae bacterium]
MEAREELQKVMDTLATQRDELILKAHLAKLEAREEWRELESKLEQLRGKSSQIADTAGDAAQDIAGAAKLLGEEIAKGYERLRRMF